MHRGRLPRCTETPTCRPGSSCRAVDPAEVLAVLQGHQDAAWNLAADGIVSCHKEIGDHGDGLVMGETLSVGFASQQTGDEIPSVVNINRPYQSRNGPSVIPIMSNRANPIPISIGSRASVSRSRWRKTTVAPVISSMAIAPLRAASRGTPGRSSAKLPVRSTGDSVPRVAKLFQGRSKYDTSLSANQGRRPPTIHRPRRTAASGPIRW
jgi:hypothetical protein